MAAVNCREGEDFLFLAFFVLRRVVFVLFDRRRTRRNDLMKLMRIVVSTTIRSYLRAGVGDQKDSDVGTGDGSGVHAQVQVNALAGKDLLVQGNEDGDALMRSRYRCGSE